MALTKKRTSEILKAHKRAEKDTGSPEVQIALFTERINYLTEHFVKFKKDHHSRQGLIRLVNKRRRLLDYLKKVSPERYQDIIKNLKIRK